MENATGMTIPKFQQEYNDFLVEYKKGLTDGERAGEIIARMAQYFAMSNAQALNAFNGVAASIEQTEDANGKAITSAKAKILSAATPEHGALIIAKTTVESIEQIINALKSLQKGIMNEYAHVGNM